VLKQTSRDGQQLYNEIKVFHPFLKVFGIFLKRQTTL